MCFGRLEQIIFSIDRGDDLHTLAKFTRFCDTLRALGKLTGSVEVMQGMYGGEPETVFMGLAVDFDEFVRNSGFVSEQESFLRIPGDVRQPCVLEYQHTGTREALDPMSEVSEQEAMENPSWTYRKGKYYVC